MKERMTVRLPAELLRRAKRKAAADGVTLTALIEDALRQTLNERTAPSKAKRILPRVSTATGGLLPGVDLNDSAALQEADDIEYVKRLNDGFGRR